jgi:hypothetical protein
MNEKKQAGITVGGEIGRDNYSEVSDRGIRTEGLGGRRSGIKTAGQRKCIVNAGISSIVYVDIGCSETIQMASMAGCWGGNSRSFPRFGFGVSH